MIGAYGCAMITSALVAGDMDRMPPLDFAGLQTDAMADPSRHAVIAHMAAFVRANPNAPAEAVAIDATRSRLDNAPWDKMEPSARAGLEVFKLMMTVLDAKLAALAPAPEPIDLPPYGEAAELLADQPGELTDQAV